MAARLRAAVAATVATASLVAGGCERYDYVNGLTCPGGRVDNVAVDLQTPMATPEAALAYAAAAAGLPPTGWELVRTDDTSEVHELELEGRRSANLSLRRVAVADGYPIDGWVVAGLTRCAG